MIRTRTPTETSGARGLGRLVEADSHLKAPEMRPWSKVVVHEDDWKWGPHEHFAFREHEGRGYWRGSRWIGW